MLKVRTGVVRQRGPRTTQVAALADALAVAAAGISSGFFLQPNRTNDKKNAPQAKRLIDRSRAFGFGTRNRVIGPALPSKRKLTPGLSRLSQKY
jgi:hypothetical protein